MEKIGADEVIAEGMEAVVTSEIDYHVLGSVRLRSSQHSGLFSRRWYRRWCWCCGHFMLEQRPFRSELRFVVAKDPMLIRTTRTWFWRLAILIRLSLPSISVMRLALSRIADTWFRKGRSSLKKENPWFDCFENLELVLWPMRLFAEMWKNGSCHVWSNCWFNQ